MLELFHTGLVVPRLEPAMAELSAVTGCVWRPVVGRTGASVWTEGGPRTLDLRRVYSVEGPPYVELVEDPSGVWGPQGPARDHHLGYWCDDLSTEAARFEAMGLARTVSDLQPDGGFRQFAYFRSSTGLAVELLPRSRQDEILN